LLSFDPTVCLSDRATIEKIWRKMEYTSGKKKTDFKLGSVKASLYAVRLKAKSSPRGKEKKI
jgi:hypothetical protein